MKKIRELLQDADPLRHEIETPSFRKMHLRQAILAAAAAIVPARVTSGLRLRRLAFVAVAVLAMLFIGSRILPRRVFETKASVLFEVHLAEETPAGDLIEMTIDGKTIYLHPDIVVSNDDIARAEVIPGNSIGVYFTSEGARKMRIATEAHLGKRIAILCDNEVVAAPTLRSVISDAAVINGDFTEEEAERIANGLR